MDIKSPESGDNLPARQKMIMQRLTSIRGNKQRILETLRGLKENLAEDEEPDRELMGKMIASYDLLSAQEEEYMKIMQQIVAIRENAAEDIEHEGKQEGQTDESIETDKKSDEQLKDDASATSQSAQPNEKSEKVDQKSDQKEPGGGTEAEWKEVQEELTKLGNVTGEAVAASIMNEKLVETLQLHRTKKAVLEEIHKKESESQRGAANEVLERVEMARLKVAAEQEQIERKRKTLERLRREAVRRGIILEPSSASEPDIVVEPQPEPKSATEAKLRAKLNAKKKQNEEQEIEDNSPPIPENLVPPERIPPIADSVDTNKEQLNGVDNSNDTTAADNASDNNNGHGSSKKKKKGKRAKQQDKERTDAINTSIREKLAAIKARKARMQEIQAQLLKPVVSESQMDETFQKAQERLKNLTAMRERLEELKECGNEVSEETVAMLERQLVEEENATAEDDKAIEGGVDITEAKSVTNDNMGPALEHIEQIVASVRSEFDKVMMNGRGGNSTSVTSGADLSPGYCLSVNDSQRLKNIEESIEQQKRLLLAINNQISIHQSENHVQSSQSALSTPTTTTTTQTAKLDDRQKCIRLIHQSLLSADSQLLNRFADIITKLANAENVPELSDFLQTLFNSSEQSFPAQASIEKKELDTTENGSNQPGRVDVKYGDEHLVSSIPIPNCELSQSVTINLQTNSLHSSSTILDGDQHEQSTIFKEERIEQAKRRLSSGKAKLQKQRTLERVRCFTGDENGEETNESEPKGDDGHVLKGLEKDICRIIEGVVPWIREYSEIVATEKIMNELRNVILQRSAAVCFPNGCGSDLFEKQLSTIIDDTLSQYYGYKIGVDREQLIFDISEVLYNELAFFQLMYNIDCMVEYKQEVKHTDSI